MTTASLSPSLPSGEHGPPRRRPATKEQFDDYAQQHDADTLGMWIFLATEILFFGGLFATYIVYRWRYALGFDEASNHLRVDLGTINTIVLLGSSFTMALAVHFAQLGRRVTLGALLLCTAVLGALFLCIKFYEWHLEAEESLIPWRSFAGPTTPGAPMFFYLYFGMTALHALHLTIGVCVVLVVAAMALFGAFGQRRHVTVEIVGLYWHYVDIVWLFLYPLLYLGGRHLAGAHG